jgi:hypothetical protein
MAEYRPVLHEAVVEKDLLSRANVVSGEDDLAAGTYDAIGDRRVGLVGAVGKQDEDEEPGEEHDSGDLQPGAGNEKLSLAPILRLLIQLSLDPVSVPLGHQHLRSRLRIRPILCGTAVELKRANIRKFEDFRA